MQAFKSQIQSATNPIQDLINKLLQAIKNLNQTPKTVFDALASKENWGAVLYRDKFVQVLLAIDPTLSAQDQERLWELADKNLDGGLTYDEFAAIFAAAPAALPASDPSWPVLQRIAK